MAPRLRRADPNAPGWTRRRWGRGFSYLDERGARLPADAAARCRSLAIPPAWVDVWICPWPNGHLQAVGTDAAGRRQYLYHPAWGEWRDEIKFSRACELGLALPAARARVVADLSLPGMSRDRALATGEVTGRSSLTAKDFRTWQGAVRALAALSEADAADSRWPAVARAMRTVSDHLGNTPTVARRSYVPPELVAAYLDGEVLPPGPPDPEEESPGWEAWEQAALEFLIR